MSAEVFDLPQHDGDAPKPKQDASDILVYSGQINRQGYESVCEQLKKQSCNRLLLVLTTPGGDPHAGFRIARAMQHHYDSFDALIPWVCKSAGTLICIGATNLYLDDQSELGPLDVQVKKHDEIIGRNSGLDILQAVNYLQNQAMVAFRTYLVELTRDAGLSTRTAADISSKLTSGLFAPIFGQVDPMRLAEMQRATDIAFAYGERLNSKSLNLRQGGLEKLVAQYPSHSFVIDRKEAASIFINVSKPNGVLSTISRALYDATRVDAYNDTAKVMLIPAKSAENQGETHENVPDAGSGAGSNAGSEQTGDGTGT